MSLHIIIVGLGQVGQHLAKVLSRENHNVVGIETDPVCCREAGENLDIQVLQGQGTDCRLLEKAGIRNADMLIALTGSDDQNVLTCQMAARYGARRKIARIRNPVFFENPPFFTLSQWGVDVTIQPEEESHLEIKLIEANPDKTLRLADELRHTLVTHGDGRSFDLLATEGILETDALVSVTNDEETNILTSLLAKHLGVTKTIALVSREEYLPLMAPIGVNAAVNINLITSNSILRLIRRGDVVSLAGLGVVTVINVLTVSLGLFNSLRHSAFQVVSIMTTTGYTTADFGQWHTAGQMVLLILMFFGGCAGSTGGSLKILRLMILFKQGRAELKKLLHPHAVIPVRVDGHLISPPIITTILAFAFLYLFCKT